jgi:DNA-binding MarR family transcriptional regulator
VLAGIAAEPGISNAALARAAFVTAQTMQGIVANLEKAGLLARSGHPTHGRILQAQLTPDGVTALRTAHGIVAKVEQAMIAGISDAEVKKMSALLAVCAENLIGEV